MTHCQTELIRTQDDVQSLHDTVAVMKSASRLHGTVDASDYLDQIHSNQLKPMHEKLAGCHGACRVVQAERECLQQDKEDLKKQLEEERKNNAKEKATFLELQEANSRLHTALAIHAPFRLEEGATTARSPALHQSEEQIASTCLICASNLYD
ncbi:hypothetical protein BU25DRAFT_424086 [Macroventuria anomochaeta]|uniref:Uncharacterized protein n=1 Tax=Macroventuria anomochaeta TaxID=301207 RepID=A0ACB6RRB2_9PLEO|nr:uncharacterized protein BU25DRAFT_424086 [Macroventuria anomochaeta]KAF2624283.1 hypothetical protein BU25DRAFT_424086 [Macroventuria anomochaeta]